MSSDLKRLEAIVNETMPHLLEDLAERSRGSRKHFEIEHGCMIVLGGDGSLAHNAVLQVKVSRKGFFLTHYFVTLYATGGERGKVSSWVSNIITFPIQKWFPEEARMELQDQLQIIVDNTVTWLLGQQPEGFVTPQLFPVRARMNLAEAALRESDPVFEYASLAMSFVTIHGVTFVGVCNPRIKSGSPFAFYYEGTTLTFMLHENSEVQERAAGVFMDTFFRNSRTPWNSQTASPERESGTSG